jgi:hypothetical protein
VLTLKAHHKETEEPGQGAHFGVSTESTASRLKVELDGWLPVRDALELEPMFRGLNKHIALSQFAYLMV